MANPRKSAFHTATMWQSGGRLRRVSTAEYAVGAVISGDPGGPRRAGEGSDLLACVGLVDQVETRHCPSRFAGLLVPGGHNSVLSRNSEQPALRSIVERGCARGRPTVTALMVPPGGRARPRAVGTLTLSV